MNVGALSTPSIDLQAFTVPAIAWDELVWQPVVPIALLGAGVVVGLLICAREAVRARGAGARLRWLPRALIVLVVAATCLRPSVPAPATTTSMSNADVYFVVDTTASMGATDGPGGVSRIDLARADVVGLAAQIAGAGSRAALITFDSDARTIVPLTTDTGAVGRAAAILKPEIAVASAGSSVTVAAALLSRTLTEVAAAYPDRASLVLYLGDGEHTAQAPPSSFEPVAALVQGGIVLGYGTAAGATMPARQTTREAATVALVQDPATGQPAVSHADEDRLRGLAGELGLGYAHRDGTAALAIPAPTVRLVVTELSELAAGSTEFTWLCALALIALLLGELAQAVLALARSGLPRTPGPRRARAKRARG